MKKHFCLLAICFIAAAPVFLPAQTAAELERLLDTEAVTYGEAAHFILQAAGIQEFSSPSEAFNLAVEREWLPANAAQDGGAVLSGVSLLIMESFGLRGGMFYSLSRSPHYAYRELVYQGVISGRTDPGMAVSGELMLFLTSRVLSQTETEPEAPAETAIFIKPPSGEFQTGQPVLESEILI